MKFTRTERAPDGVRRYLDLSTAHLAHNEGDALSDNFGDVDLITPRVIDHRYGWWVNVMDPVDHEGDYAALKPLYPNLHAILLHAAEHGCTWINFDQDASTIAALPTYEW